MSLHLYDTATRTKTEFKPLVEGKVSIYACGPTVQKPPHLGHVRKEVNFDVLRRWLEHAGHEVTLVANITDIDDKILALSAETGEPWWALGYRVEGQFHEAIRALGVRPPTYEPKATGHIPEMVELIAELIDAGHAYAADDGSGDVYFDVASWPAYGSLSGMRADEMASDEEADLRGKRDPRDFALWKGTKPGEPATASWPAPWGRGRPGWHIECSAMAGKYLGPEFDIHGGGLDLRFPHHENEMAQSQAAGRPFARVWMHNAWVTMAGEKMSKSLGNTADVGDAVAQYGGRAVRLYLAGPHYRSAIELSDASLAESAAQLERIDSFLARAGEVLGEVAFEGTTGDRRDARAAFTAAMDDDLGTPAALAALFGRVKDGNQAIASGDRDAVGWAAVDVTWMLGILGLDPAAPEWAHTQGAASDDLTGVVDALVGTMLEQRAAARANKDWAAADAIRDSLAAAGLTITDTKDGARWSRERG
ncbi:cysteine--tRNA ligase [Propioniciclava sp. MC1683]|uniref:cysteine--tRNA ligase n=1 Tax=Propioniciclava sp. MC1683 TaxID=2760309 RepID=UPI001600E4C6|nr:cysteine--tRNA ligase [Propioniciclava sp. MC1683]MBB1501373.1 cysteine--tRNA ligase [Propioniciclava sp. MC1683]